MRLNLKKGKPSEKSKHSTRHDEDDGLGYLNIEGCEYCVLRPYRIITVLELAVVVLFGLSKVDQINQRVPLLVPRRKACLL